MMEQDYFGLQEYRINYDEIARRQGEYFIAPEISKIIISSGGLCGPGECIKQIKTPALMDFVERIESDESETNSKFAEELFLIGLMMYKAEGGIITNSMVENAASEKESKLISSIYDATIMFLVLESLFRKGLIDLKHNNISYDEAAKSRMIAKIKPGVKLDGAEYDD